MPMNGTVGPPPPDDQLPRNDDLKVGDRVVLVRDPDGPTYTVTEVYQPRCKAQLDGHEKVVEFLTSALTGV